MRNKLLLCTVAVAIGLFSTGAVAAPNAMPELQRTVIAGGGGRIEDGTRFVLRSTIGEAVAGGAAVQDDRAVASGFWQKLPGLYDLFVPFLQK